jgi:hypothetical protein
MCWPGGPSGLQLVNRCPILCAARVTRTTAMPAVPLSRPRKHRESPTFWQASIRTPPQAPRRRPTARIPVLRRPPTMPRARPPPSPRAPLLRRPPPSPRAPLLRRPPPSPRAPLLRRPPPSPRAPLLRRPPPSPSRHRHRHRHRPSMRGTPLATTGWTHGRSPHLRLWTSVPSRPSPMPRAPMLPRRAVQRSRDPR